MSGAVSYKPLIEDFVWSYSRLQQYQTCKWGFFLKYIRGWSEEDTFYATYGSFMHEIIEGFYRGEMTKDDMLTKFLSSYQDRVHGSRPANVSGSSYIQKGIDYLKGFQPFPYNMVAVEEKIDFTIDGIPFRGIVDYIGEKDGELYIVDNKSRDLKPRSQRPKPTVKDKELDKMLTQLYIYAAAVEQKYGKLPKELCFNCFKNQQFITEPFVMERYEESKKLAVDLVHEIEENLEWEDSEYDYFQCNFLCGLHNDCEIYLDEKGW